VGFILLELMEKVRREESFKCVHMSLALPADPRGNDTYDFVKDVSRRYHTTGSHCLCLTLPVLGQVLYAHKASQPVTPSARSVPVQVDLDHSDTPAPAPPSIGVDAYADWVSVYSSLPDRAYKPLPLALAQPVPLAVRVPREAEAGAGQGTADSDPWDSQTPVLARLLCSDLAHIGLVLQGRTGVARLGPQPQVWLVTPAPAPAPAPASGPPSLRPLGDNGDPSPVFFHLRCPGAGGLALGLNPRDETLSSLTAVAPEQAATFFCGPKRLMVRVGQGEKEVTRGGAGGEGEVVLEQADVVRPGSWLLGESLEAC
jgi:hypothetical protein